MSKNIILLLLLSSSVASLYLYLQPKGQLEEILTTRQWENNNVIIRQDNLNTNPDNSYLPIRGIHVHSNVRYLPQGNYVKSATINVYLQRDFERGKPDETFKISESGTWELINNYLLTNQVKVEEWPPKKESILSKIQIKEIKERFVFEEQQSKRIDIVRDESILLVTYLNKKSHILVSQ